MKAKNKLGAAVQLGRRG